MKIKPQKIASLGLYFFFIASAQKTIAVEPIRESIEYTTSVAHAYDSRSVFTNPAALGFQSMLNGSQLLTSVSFGLNETRNTEYSWALSYGSFGFGSQRLITAAGEFSRYNLALGFPLHPRLFFGARYAFTRSDASALNGLNSIDLGLQIRASRYWSLGFLAETINQPDINQNNTPTRFVLGTVIRPFKPLEIMADVSTLSPHFGKSVGYEVNANIEVLRGFRISGGYHKDRKWQVGVQLNLGLNAYYSVSQPTRSEKSLLIGTQMALKPYPSFVEVNTALEVAINEKLSEQPVRGSLFSSGRPSLIQLLKRLERATNTSSVRLVIVRLQKFPLGFAAAQDVYQALWALRKQGKQVEVYLESAGLKEYLVASAAQRIYMEKGAELRLTGLKESRYFLKGTLDKIGIRGELFAKGKYKSAPEIFTRKESSPIARQASLERLKKMEQIIVRLLSRSKRLDSNKWKQTLQHALFSAQDAKTWGLIDGVESYSDNEDRIRRTHLLRSHLDKQKNALALPSRVTVVVANGDILKQSRGFFGVMGNQVTASRMEKKLERAASDPLTKAIVLRISSPGGEILPSQKIASMVKKISHDKPVIVSMGDVAASGGYLIASPAQHIFAQDLSLTGSIGVFLGKADLSQLYKKIDLHKEVLSYAPFADLYSEDRSLKPAAQKILLRRLDQYYGEFVDWVAEHRKLSRASAEQAAQGKVWLGSQAKPIQLTDSTGSYLDSVTYASRVAGMDPSQYETVVLLNPSPWFSLMGEGGLLQNTRSESNLLPLLSRELLHELHWASILEEQPFLYRANLGTVE